MPNYGKMALNLTDSNTAYRQYMGSDTLFTQRLPSSTFPIHQRSEILVRHDDSRPLIETSGLCVTFDGCSNCGIQRIAFEHLVKRHWDRSAFLLEWCYVYFYSTYCAVSGCSWSELRLAQCWSETHLPLLGQKLWPTLGDDHEPARKSDPPTQHLHANFHKLKMFDADFGDRFPHKIDLRLQLFSTWNELPKTTLEAIKCLQRLMFVRCINSRNYRNLKIGLRSFL